MKLYYFQFTREQVRDLTSVLQLAIEDAEGDLDQTDAQEQIGVLQGIIEVLEHPASTVEGMAREIHQLKNKVQALQMEMALKEKES